MVRTFALLVAVSTIALGCGDGGSDASASVPSTVRDTVAEVSTTIAGALGDSLPAETPTPSAQADAKVDAIAATDEIVYFGGELTSVRPAGAAPGSGQARGYAAAFDPATGDVLPWDPGFDGPVRSLVISHDGSTLYAGGWFGKAGGEVRKGVAAFDVETGALTDWAPQAEGRVEAIAVAPDGESVFVGGSYGRIAGKPQGRLAKVDAATGSLVADFSPEVEGNGGANVRSLALSPDGLHLYAGGRFDSVDGQPLTSVAKVDVRTGIPLPWDPDVRRKDDARDKPAIVYALAVSGENVYLCGDFFGTGGVISSNVAAVLATDGSRSPLWESSTDGSVNDCAVSGAHLYLGGHFDRVGGINADPRSNPDPTGVIRYHVAAVDLRTGSVSEWDPGADSIEGLYAVVVRPDVLYTGGTFAVTGGARQQAIARFTRA